MSAGSVAILFTHCEAKDRSFPAGLFEVVGNSRSYDKLTSFRIGCIAPRRLKLTVGTVPASNVDLCPSDTTLSFLLSRHHCVPSITSGLQRIGRRS